MTVIQQGTILRLPDMNQTVLVLSREFFNQTGMLIVCPVYKTAKAAALNIPITTDQISGIAILDQMRSIDIRVRFYSILGEISIEQIQNISDAVQDIFDYFPFSS